MAALCTDIGNTLTTAFTQCLKATPAFIASLPTTFGSADCASLQIAASSGRVQVNSSIFPTCINALQSAAANCTDFGSTFLSSACQGVVTGTVATGGACYGDVDCAAGTCDTSSACPGACIAFLTAGQTCGSGKADCGPGLDCDGSVCKQQSATGGTCPCQSGNYCDSTSNTCLAKKTSGACASGDECSFATTCVQGQCTAYVAVGSACTPGNSPSDPSACGIGSFCDPASKQCIDWPVIGQSCASFPVCQTGYCDPGTMSCTAPKPAGATCASPIECQSGNYCDLNGDHTCKTQKSNGTACSLGFECQSETCTGGSCVAASVGCVEK